MRPTSGGRTLPYNHMGNSPAGEGKMQKADLVHMEFCKKNAIVSIWRGVVQHLRRELQTVLLLDNSER